MKRLFFGGIHPKYNKEMSTEITDIQKISPKFACLPMQQHIGAPCTPLVKVGDYVIRGQKIGDGDGMCVPVHASVSGKVVAVEKGTNQMKEPLRFDSRIELHEKTDIFDCTRESLDADFKVILADVSFVSLKKVLLHARFNLASPDTDFLVMLKPQFEAKSFELKNGIVKNEKIRRDIIKEFEKWLKKYGFIIVKKRDNDLFGKNGNLERFYLLKLAKKSIKIY